jgi:hypothetical protein
MPSKMEGQSKAGNASENINGSNDASAPPLDAKEVDVELLPLGTSYLIPETFFPQKKGGGGGLFGTPQGIGI